MPNPQAIALPKLPEPDGYAAISPEGTHSIIVRPDQFGSVNGYAVFTADQMNAHGLACYEAGRAAASGQAGWQAIETAPMDGSGVLALWVHPGDSVTARNYALVEFVRGCWRDTESDDQVYTQPTHWMPLPAAPGATSPSALVASPPSPDVAGEAKVQP